MIENQDSSTTSKVNMKENDDHIIDFDDYNAYESPDNLLNDLDESIEKNRMQSAKVEFENKEQSLNNQISFLESRALLAEEENIKLREHIDQIEKELGEQKLINEKQQSDLIQSEDKYDKLVSKLLYSFNCHSIDEIFKISNKLIDMELEINRLTSNLDQTQIQLSEISVSSIGNKKINPQNEVLNSLSKIKKEEMDKLTRQFKRSKEKIELQNQEIEYLKTQINDIKKNDDKIQSEYSRIKANSSNFERENQELQDANRQLFDEFTEFKAQQSKELTEMSKRFKILNQISKRLDPKFLMIQNHNILYPIFDNLSMLFQGISDLEIDPQIIVQGLMEISNVVQNAMNEIEKNLSMSQSSSASNNEEIIQLKGQIEDYKDQIQKLEDDLQEMLENDAAPELLTWISKCKQLELELISLKQTQNQNQALNQSLNFSQSPAQQSRKSVFLQKPQ